MIRKKEAKQEGMDVVDIANQNIWVCAKCELTLDYLDMMKHIKGVHGIEKRTGTRTLLLHGDAKQHTMSVYEWEISGLKLNQISLFKKKVPKVVVTPMFDTPIKRRKRGKRNASPANDKER